MRRNRPDSRIEDAMTAADGRWAPHAVRNSDALE